MTIVRELITKLSFSLDNTGLGESLKQMDKVKRKAQDMQQTLKKSIGWTPTSTITRTLDPLQIRTEKIFAYKKELEQLNVFERKETKALNAAEKQAIREITAEQRKQGAQKRRLDMEEKRRLAEIKKEKRKTNILSDLNTINQAANRALLGIFGGIAASVGFSYKEYKNYKKNQAEGRIVKTSLTSDQIKQFDAFDKIAKTFGKTIANLRNAFSVALLPAITSVLKEFNEFYKVNKKIINEKIKYWAGQIGEAFKKVWRILNDYVLPVVGSIINAFGGLRGVILGLIGIKVIGWIGAFASALFSPLVPILLLLGGLYLLYDEIEVTMKGGESYLNDLANSETWQAIAKKIQWLENMMATLRNTLGLNDFVDWVNERPEDAWKRKAKEKKDQEKADASIRHITSWPSKKDREKTDASIKNTGSTASLYTVPAMKYLSKGLDKPIEPIARTLTTSMSEYKSKQVTNNVGGIKIVINNTGNIDDSSIPQVAKMIEEKITQAFSGNSDDLSFAKAGQMY